MNSNKMGVMEGFVEEAAFELSLEKWVKFFLPGERAASR